MSSKEHIRNRSGVSRDQKSQWIDSLKAQPCLDCGGVFPPECMDFDHRPDAVKSFTISQSRNKPKQVILAEIEKCDVVCANCHRIRTRSRLVKVRYPFKLHVKPPGFGKKVSMSRLSQEDVPWEIVSAEYRSGKTLKQLGEKYNVSLGGLSKGLRRNGVEMRSRGATKK